MWLLRKLLAYFHIHRIASLKYEDGKIRDAKIMNESRNDLCVLANTCYGIWQAVWIRKTEPTICKIQWSSDARLTGSIVAFIAICLLIPIFFSVISVVT